MAALMLAAIQIKSQTNMNLTDKQQALVAIAANEAKGDLKALKKEVNAGFEAGLTISEVKEALSQLYAYTGFPRSLNALGVLQQVLICVAGRGWYQEWGKPAVEMTPGTVIAIPAEVKHWHGAAADSWFQHLTYHKDVQQGASNEWLEPVDDESYNKVK